MTYILENCEYLFTSSTIKDELDEAVIENPKTYFVHMQKDRYYPQLPRFSENVDQQVYDGQTVLYMATQIAVYLGFREIYYLGADNHYSVELNRDGTIRRDSEMKDYPDGMGEIELESSVIPQIELTTMSFGAVKSMQMPMESACLTLLAEGNWTFLTEWILIPCFEVMLMKIVAIVPIKLNNERLPGKNTKMLGDRPLISYILETLSACDALDERYVFAVMNAFVIIFRNRSDFAETRNTGRADHQFHTDFREFSGESSSGYICVCPCNRTLYFVGKFA